MATTAWRKGGPLATREDLWQTQGNDTSCVQFGSIVNNLGTVIAIAGVLRGTPSQREVFI